MRYIHRNKEDALLEDFKVWLQTNHKKIKEDIANPEVKGSQIWNFFKNEGNTAYQSLKKHLVETQGYLCCYCGQRIKNDQHTAIEHIKPKSKHKTNIFDYNNLIASCIRGKSNKIHVVQKDETLPQIAEIYGVDIEHLEDVYVNTDELKLFREKYDIENLSTGDRIVIFPIINKKFQHCDLKKGKDEIEITPLQKNCANYFDYNRSNGEIKITPDNKLTLNVLGLNNNRYLNRLREKKINDSFIIKENLVADFGHSKKSFAENLQNIIKNLDDVTRTPNSKFEPFVFVKIWSLLN